METFVKIVIFRNHSFTVQSLNLFFLESLLCTLAGLVTRQHSSIILLILLLLLLHRIHQTFHYQRPVYRI